MKAALVSATLGSPRASELSTETSTRGAPSSFAARYDAAVASLAPTTDPLAERSAPCAVEVESGDTLWGLVRRQLEAAGGRASDRDVLAGVRAAAARNGLDDPDRIVPGQTIELGELDAAPPADGADTIRSEAALAAPTGEAPATAQGTVDVASLLAGNGERVTSHFGMRRDPLCGNRRFHSGIDIAAPQGTAVRAAAGGTVTFAGTQGGYGRTVIIEHGGGVSSVYAHLSEVLVRAGEHVDAATDVARVGRTGRATGSHLHFEVRRDGVAVDPAVASLELDDRA